MPRYLSFTVYPQFHFTLINTGPAIALPLICNLWKITWLIFSLYLSFTFFFTLYLDFSFLLIFYPLLFSCHPFFSASTINFYPYSYFSKFRRAKDQFNFRANAFAQLAKYRAIALLDLIDKKGQHH